MLIVYIVFPTVAILCVLSIMIHHSRQMLRLQKQHLEDLEALLSQEQDTLQQMHMLQHDVQNHYLTIQSLIETGRMEEAHSYVVHLRQELKKLV